MHQYLEIGNDILIPTYNLLIGIGAIFGFLHLEKEIKFYKLNFQTDRNIYFSLIIAILFGFFGAKLFELIYHNNDFNFYNFFKAGATYMGGLISGVIIFYFINMILNTSNKLAFNLLIPSILIAHSFGRIGCFFAGCCYGKPTNLFIGVSYPAGSLPAQHFGSDIHLHPTQIYESLFIIFLFFAIIKIVHFNYRTPVYFFSYGLFRFFIEFIRADDRGHLITELLTPSQLLSILFFVTGVLVFIYIRMSKKRALQ